MHYFLLGPSGAGKPFLGNWLAANRQFHHIQVDNGDDHSELEQKEPTLWKLWVQGNPKTPFETSPLFIDVANKFSDELQKCAKANSKPAGCVLTFWSYTVFGPSEINALAKHNIAVRYLYGPKEKCIEAAFGRDPAKWSQDEAPARAHWCQHNQTYQRIGGPGLSECRVDAFQPSGDRRSEFEIAAELMGPAPGRV